MALEYKLEVFEGPLDMLLTLIARHKLDIYDINITELVRQYTEQIRLMRENEMEVSSEFLEMAARLVYIKSVSLLPVYDEGEQLKKELQGELIEYMDCKLIAGKLAELTDGFSGFVRPMQPVPADWTYRRYHDPLELLNAFLDAAGKQLRKLPPPQEAFQEIVKKAVVSVGSRMRMVYGTLRKTGRLKLMDLFAASKSRSELVASFLAVLELARDGVIDLTGEGAEMGASLTGKAPDENAGGEEYDG